jgi:hypothetical protein
VLFVTVAEDSVVVCEYSVVVVNTAVFVVVVVQRESIVVAGLSCACATDNFLSHGQ